MLQDLGSALITIECGECSHRMEETAARLDSDIDIRCTDCASLVWVDRDQLKRALTQFAVAYQALGTTRTGFRTTSTSLPSPFAPSSLVH